MTPAARELLSLLSQCPIPIGRTDKRLKKELIKLGFAEAVTSEITTMNTDASGALYPAYNRIGVMLCITDLGKRQLDDVQQEK